MTWKSSKSFKKQQNTYHPEGLFSLKIKDFSNILSINISEERAIGIAIGTLKNFAVDDLF